MIAGVALEGFAGDAKGRERYGCFAQVLFWIAEPVHLILIET